MIDAGLMSFVLESLPSAPARVVEVGAGDGELARALLSAGYDVVAIDPASDAGGVRAIPLHELSEPPASFDAALGVLSMHHVEPLDRSCQRLGELVGTGGPLVLDEIDFERFDDRAAAWWLDHRERVDEHGSSPAEIVGYLRHHCHMLSDVLAALEHWFEFGELTRGPYLYRWDLSPDLRAEEVELIAAGRLPATGARIVGTRR
jgi:SAM-dependent methyltransferase